MKCALTIIGILSVSLGMPAQVAAPARHDIPVNSQAVPSVPTPLQEQLEELQQQYGANNKLKETTGAEVILNPKPGTQNLDVSGDARSIYTRIGAAFGIRIGFDDSTPSRFVRFKLEQADFQSAMDLAGLMTKTFWVPVSSGEVLIAADNAQKRRELDRMLERTFYFPEVSTPQELNDIVNSIRTLLEVRFVAQSPANSSITVRAPQRTMYAVEQLVSSFSEGRPQVMLDVQAYEVSRQMLRNIGINLPLQFQMFDIGAAAIAALGSADIQSLIAQLLSSGGLNSANGGALSALIAQLQNQQQALLQNPLATFGGGMTLFGIGVPPVTANFGLNESRVQTLEQATLRASQGNAATLHVGTRYPVLTQSFSSGFSLPGVNTAITGAAPGFTYEDLGITLKAKPQIHGLEAVTLDMELSIKALGGQSYNSVPVIQNREYKGMITVKNGEPAVMAGIMSNSEQETLNGVPGFSQLPVLNRFLSEQTKNDQRDELIIVVTPHIIRTGAETSPSITVPRQ